MARARVPTVPGARAPFGFSVLEHRAPWARGTRARRARICSGHHGNPVPGARAPSEEEALMSSKILNNIKLITE